LTVTTGVDTVRETLVELGEHRKSPVNDPRVKRYLTLSPCY